MRVKNQDSCEVLTCEKFGHGTAGMRSRAADAWQSSLETSANLSPETFIYSVSQYFMSGLDLIIWHILIQADHSGHSRQIFKVNNRIMLSL